MLMEEGEGRGGEEKGGERSGKGVVSELFRIRS